MLIAAEWLVRILEAYVALGFVFGTAFLARGIERIDPLSRGARAGFRLMILPGVVALWPLLLRRWIGARP